MSRSKWVLLWWMTIVWAMGSRAQFEPLLYRNYGNPLAVFSSASMPMEGEAYWVTPFVPQGQIQFGLSGPTLWDLFGADGRDFNLKWREALKQMNSRQGVISEAKLQALALGIRKDDKVFRAGIYTQWQSWYFHPVSLYEFLVYGNNRDNFVLDLSDINFNFEALHVIYFGMSRSLPGGGRWGYQLKIYNSAGSFSSTGNQGKIYQKPGRNNYYRHMFDHIDLKITSSGLSHLVFEDKLGQEGMDSATVVRDFMRRFEGTNNWGAGLDVGFEKVWKGRYTWAAGVEDFGIIRYADDNLSFRMRGNYSYEGVYIRFPKDPQEYWGDVKEEFNKYLPSEIHTRVFYRWRPFKVYTSLERRFKGKPGTIACYHPGREGRAQQACPDSYVGAVAFYQNLMGRLYAGLGVYGQYFWAPGSYLRVSLASDTFNVFRVGLGGGWRLGPLNMYVWADNLAGLADISRSHGQYLALGAYWNL
ncbi:MAG: hypothetical protein GXO24_03315 [Chlorobi bacterium]|nr:hypothetical protein [Chlorobiota bacterium]